MTPLLEFLREEAASSVLLFVAAVVAVVWANGPWSAAYDSLWAADASLTIAHHSLHLDLRGWLNDGLMTIFFLVVGLEIKRELTSGHLATRRSALLPVVGAIGGMVVPALIYLAVAGSRAPHGFGVPMATDIALAVGVVTIAGARVSTPMRAFLLGVAIVDDIGAIVVIAVAYSTGIRWSAMFLAALAVAIAIVLRRAGARPTVAYVAVGAVLWVALFKAGIHPTIAGVIMGLLAPTTPRVTSRAAVPEETVVEWLERMLHPWASLAIVPLFALANAGVHVSLHDFADAATSPIAWGIVTALVLGKPIGVLGASFLAARAGLADLPPGSSRRQLLGVGSSAGIGFTVALFIADLAFTDEAQRAEAKLAIFVGSLIAAAAASAILSLPHPRAARRGRDVARSGQA